MLDEQTKTIAFGDLKIRAQSIRDIAGSWCEDWEGAVRYFLRHRQYVTVRQAVDDFDGNTWTKQEEDECPTCGQYVERETEEDNPEVLAEHIIRLFTDLDEAYLVQFIENAESAHLDWLEAPIDLHWYEENKRGWVYREPVIFRVADWGHNAGDGDTVQGYPFEGTEQECREWIDINGQENRAVTETSMDTRPRYTMREKVCG